MDQETNDLIARQYLSEKNLGQVESDEFTEWASLQIEKGHNSESLRKLAGSTSAADASSVEGLFRECISDMGLEYPSKKVSLKQHSESILHKIVDGKMEPYDGCSQLYINSIYLGHPDYLYNWNGLFWAREDLEVEELNELILEEARKQLAGEATPANESLPRHEEEDEDSPGFLARLRELVRWR